MHSTMATLVEHDSELQCAQVQRGTVLHNTGLPGDQSILCPASHFTPEPFCKMFCMLQHKLNSTVIKFVIHRKWHKVETCRGQGPGIGPGQQKQQGGVSDTCQALRVMENIAITIQTHCLLLSVGHKSSNDGKNSELAHAAYLST